MNLNFWNGLVKGLMLIMMTPFLLITSSAAHAQLDERVVSQLYHNVFVTGKDVEFELNNSYTSVGVQCQFADKEDEDWSRSILEIEAADNPIVRKSVTGNMFLVSNLFPGREYICKIKSEIVRFMTDGPPRKSVATSGVEIENPKDINIQTVTIKNRGYNQVSKSYKVSFEPDELKMHQEYALRCRDQKAYQSGFLLDLKVFHAYRRKFEGDTTEATISIPDLPPSATYQCQLFLRSIMGESHIIWKQTTPETFTLDAEGNLEIPEEAVEVSDPFTDLQLVGRRKIMKFMLSKEAFSKLSGRTRIIYQFYDSSRERTRIARRRITARELEKGMFMPYLEEDAAEARIWVKDPNFTSHNIKYQINLEGEVFEKEGGDEGESES